MSWRSARRPTYVLSVLSGPTAGSLLLLLCAAVDRSVRSLRQQKRTYRCAVHSLRARRPQNVYVDRQKATLPWIWRSPWPRPRRWGVDAVAKVGAELGRVLR
jgi:hypothetical protein